MTTIDPNSKVSIKVDNTPTASITNTSQPKTTIDVTNSVYLKYQKSLEEQKMRGNIKMKEDFSCRSFVLSTIAAGVGFGVGGIVPSLLFAGLGVNLLRMGMDDESKVPPSQVSVIPKHWDLNETTRSIWRQLSPAAVTSILVRDMKEAVTEGRLTKAEAQDLFKQYSPMIARYENRYNFLFANDVNSRIAKHKLPEDPFESTGAPAA